MSHSDQNEELARILADLRQAVREAGPAKLGSAPLHDMPATPGQLAQLLDELGQQVTLSMQGLSTSGPFVRRLIRHATNEIGWHIGSNWYTYNLLLQQSTVNNLLLQALRGLMQRLALQENQADEQNARLAKIEAQVSELAEHERNRSSQYSALEEDLRLRVAALEHARRLQPSEGTQSAAPSNGNVPKHATTNAADIDYFAFEMKFRGSRSLIRERQRLYLDVFANCGDILDIGCGRGEFVQLMLQQGARVRGIEANPQMVAFCQGEGLPVEQADAFTYLQRLPDNSLDGLFCSQVIEHLETGYLLRLLDVSHAKLRPGAPIVLETPNPLSLSIYARSFFQDPTHVKPVHPATLQFLLEQAGFWETELRLSGAVPESERLREYSTGTSGTPDLIASANENIRKLNDVLFGCMDYALIARKVVWPQAALQPMDAHDAEQ